MKNLFSLSDSVLTHQLRSLVQEERRITLDILHHLREVDRRRLFAERGYPSLFEYCVRELGYSESAAYRRISTMRALKETPELESAIQTGSLSLTTVARVQTFLRTERLQHQRAHDPKELFLKLEGKSSREIEKELIGISPESALPKEEIRVVSESLTEIRFLADEALLRKLKELRDLASHRLKDPTSYAELFSVMATELIAKLNPAKARPKETVAAPEVKPQTVVPEIVMNTQKGSVPHSRYIPRAVKAEVWKKAESRCTYVDRGTGKKCNSTFRLQIDHKTPFALGGSSRDPKNLTLLCFAHNQFRAMQVFGPTGRKKQS